LPYSTSHPFPGRFDVDSIEARLRDLGRREAYRFPKDVVPSHFRRSSVLIGLWREEDDLRVLLTKRAETLSGHPGQMSFPGGQLEAGEDWIAAALRETEEEVGIARDQIEVLGRLDDAWSGAGHLIAPIVGWLEEAPICTPNPAEVSEIHTPGIASFFEDKTFSREAFQIGDETFHTPIFSWEGGRLFGLSTDLLIETIRWGIGFDEGHGPKRLDSFRSYLRQKEREREELEAETIRDE
jgi:8-oxo-dGTP pyrophosphatase MutT (NUDIX family)